MKALIFAAFVVCLPVSPSALSQEPSGDDRFATYRAQFEELKADLLSAEERFKGRYADQLKKLEEDAVGSGDLDLVIAVREEAKAFRSRSGIPKPSPHPELARLQKIYVEQIATIRSDRTERLLMLMKGHHSRLVDLRTDLTKAKKIDDAVAVQGEIKSLDEELQRVRDGKAVAESTPLVKPPSATPDPPDELPDPDGKPANHFKPVKVFILMGEGNMIGCGRVGSEGQKGALAHLTKSEKKYPHLVDDTGKWTERNDVRNVHFVTGKETKNGWLTVDGGVIGPDLQFGYVMGEALEEPVLVLKACNGNRSLGWDLLPPGSEQFEHDGKIYAGYKESPNSWPKGSRPKPIDWHAGKQYDMDVADAKNVLKNLAKYYPGYRGQGYEIGGFVFWQGLKDQTPALASRYEHNLVQLIKSLRKDFEAPEAKFVAATIAFGGDGLSGHGLTIAKAQLAVSGETGNYPEFRGNVKTIDARPFWRDGSVSPTGDRPRYNHNAEIFMEVGNALGRAMAEMIQ